MDTRRINGTPWHIGYVKSKDDRKRSKNRCIHFDEETHTCEFNDEPCHSTVYCPRYKDDGSDGDAGKHKREVQYERHEHSTSLPKMISYYKTNYGEGKYIHHKQLGSGVIEKLVIKDDKVTIDVKFQNGATKSLSVIYLEEKNLINPV